MPSGKVHFAAGALCSAAFMYYTKQPVEYGVIGGVAALLPDSDKRNTAVGHFLPMWWFCKHRGFTHSFLALFLITYAAYYMNPYVGHVVFLGYLSHLLLDSLTPRGNMLFWPKQKYYGIRRRKPRKGGRS